MIQKKVNISLFEHTEKLNRYLNKGLANGEKYTVYVLDKKPIRSIPQNKYYWGIVLHYISDYLGYTVEEVHELMKLINNAKGYRTKIGKRIEVGQSTSKLTKEQFSNYVDRVRNWSKEELNLIIPTPEELKEIDYISMIEKGVF